LSNKEIAQALVISPQTVKRHATNLYQKLQAGGRREAVAKRPPRLAVRPLSPYISIHL
jgi:ATP/maltotriose-dependent transcriptional regulator MalT